MTGLKDSVQTRYITMLIKILLEFTRFYKLQKVVKNRIHFNAR